MHNRNPDLNAGLIPWKEMPWHHIIAVDAELLTVVFGIYAVAWAIGPYIRP